MTLGGALFAQAILFAFVGAAGVLFADDQLVGWQETATKALGIALVVAAFFSLLGAIWVEAGVL